MTYLIDSDIVIDHLADEPAAVNLLRHLAQAGIAISVVTYMEVYQGILRSSDPVVAHAKFHAFLTGVEIIPFFPETARRCADVREGLRRRGRRVRSRALDLLTAATALEHSLTVVTRNTADYDDIPGLALRQYQPPSTR